MRSKENRKKWELIIIIGKNERLIGKNERFDEQSKSLKKYFFPVIKFIINSEIEFIEI